MKTETDTSTQTIALQSVDEFEFDPLEDTEPIFDEDSDEFYGEYQARDDISRTTVLEDNRPAEERIEELFNRMKLRRKVLIGILDFCREPQAVEATNELVATLQQNDRSVFSGASFCAALEKAGALVKQTAEGKVITEEAPEEPEVVVVDGVEYLEARPQVDVFFKTTREGLAVVEADKPLERLTELFEADERYKPVYKRILTLCAEEGGASADELGTAVDKDPLVQEPRLFAPHFFEKLERCDALYWSKTWQTTEIGTKGLELLADVVDQYNHALRGE